MKNDFAKKLALVASLTAAGALTACGGGGGGGGSDSTVTAAGTLQVSMTDAPACGFDKVYVTVSKVRVHKAADAAETADGWSEIVLSPARKIDLLELTNGVLEDLGQTSLPVGTYNQMRLVLASNASSPMANAVVPTDTGVQTELSTPSAVQSGLKLNGTFEVAEGATTSLALDFDACKSIVKRGNGSFGLKPVIRIIPMAASGGISGNIDPAVAATGTAVVSAQVDGETVRSTVAKSDGSFSLSPLEAGTYTVVLTGAARATDVISSVPVTASATTVVSNAGAPMLTQTSADGALTGKLSPADAEGAMTAFQSVAGNRVVIKYQGADITTGDYSMTLPQGAPRHGQYSATLPIGLTPQTSAAGKYQVQASAQSYRVQPLIDVDLTGGTAKEDITLAP